MKIYRKMKDQALKSKWLKALRSGKYSQGKRFLKTAVVGTEKFCCLGVLVDIASAEELGVSHKEWGSPGLGIDSEVAIILRTKDGLGVPVAGSLPSFITEEVFEKADRAGVGYQEVVINPVGCLITMNDIDNNSFDQIADWIEKNL